MKQCILLFFDKPHLTPAIRNSPQTVYHLLLKKKLKGMFVYIYSMWVFFVIEINAKAIKQNVKMHFFYDVKFTPSAETYAKIPTVYYVKC